MTGVQLAALIVVAVAGTAVVFTPDALRQALVLGIYGLALTLLFFAFQAPGRGPVGDRGRPGWGCR